MQVGSHSQAGQPVDQVQPPGCWNRAVSSCMRYCYFVPQPGIIIPTACERIRSAFGGFCKGAFVSLAVMGVSSAIARTCEKSGIHVNFDLFLKIVIPIASTPPIAGPIHGALHPAQDRLRRNPAYLQLPQVTEMTIIDSQSEAT